jgi:mannose-6-phosphate isomerase-like protein (cupin superfamily)
MKITKVNEIPINENPHKVDARKIYDKDSAQAIHILLNPGESLKPHITPVDVFFYIIEGTPEILIGDEKQQVEPDCLIENSKDIVHCLYNNSSGIVRILVVKAPKPLAKTRLL